MAFAFRTNMFSEASINACGFMYWHNEASNFFYYTILLARPPDQFLDIYFVISRDGKTLGLKNLLMAGPAARVTRRQSAAFVHDPLPRQVGVAKMGNAADNAGGPRTAA